MFDTHLDSFTWGMMDPDVPSDRANINILASPDRLDRILIRDDVSQKIPYPHFPGGEDFPEFQQVPIHNIHKVEFVKDYPVGADIKAAMEESEWGEKTYAKDGVNGAVYVIGEQIIVRGRFSYALNEYVATTVGDDSYLYNSKYEYWVIDTSHLGSEEDYLKVEELERYKYVSSPSYKALCEGIPEWSSLMEQRADIARKAGYELPSGFKTNRTPLPHQVTAILHMAKNKRTLLADQVGLGKGGAFIGGFLCQAEFNVNHLNQNFADQWPLLIVTNNSLKDNIAKEATVWNEEAVVYVMSGKKQADIPAEATVIVSNVDILSARADDIIAADPKGMIVDESQSLKSGTSQRYKAALKISASIRERHDDPYIVLASATPLVNRPAELYSQLEILGYGKFFADYARQFSMVSTRKIRTAHGYREIPLDDRSYFDTRWCAGHTDKFGVWDNKGHGNRVELNRMLVENVGMVRRRKEEVLHPMPECYETAVAVELDRSAREYYDEVAKNFREWSMGLVKNQVRNADAFESLNARERNRAIRAAVSEHDEKLKNAEFIMQLVKLREALASIKIPFIKDWIHDFMDDDSPITGGAQDRRKLIVFAEHQEVLDALCDDPELQEYGLLSLRAGSKRQDKEVEAFQSDPDKRLIVCYSGAKEGHTMTAAKDILVVEMPQGYAPIVQIAGRCYARVSEQFAPHEAYIHFPVIPGSYEEKVFANNLKKKSHSDIVIDGLAEEDEDGQEAVNSLADIIEGQLSVNLSK